MLEKTSDNTLWFLIWQDDPTEEGTVEDIGRHCRRNFNSGLGEDIE